MTQETQPDEVLERLVLEVPIREVVRMHHWLLLAPLAQPVRATPHRLALALPVEVLRVDVLVVLTPELGVGEAGRIGVEEDHG